MKTSSELFDVLSNITSEVYKTYLSLIKDNPNIVFCDIESDDTSDLYIDVVNEYSGEGSTVQVYSIKEGVMTCIDDKRGDIVTFQFNDIGSTYDMIELCSRIEDYLKNK